MNRRFAPMSKDNRRTYSLYRKQDRLSLEMLESRLLLAVVQWTGGSGDWNTGSNWSNGVGPGPADDAVINVAGNITVTHSSGSHTIQSLSASDGLTLSGGTLDITGNLSGSGPLSFTGGTLRHATLSSGTSLIVANTGAKILDQVTINGTLDAATNTSWFEVRNGMTLGGTVNLGNSAGSTTGSFNLQGSTPLLGTGTVVVGAHGGNYFGCRNIGETTTISTGITIRASRGQIGYSGCNLINQGTIDAVPGVGIDVHFGAGGGVSTGSLAVSGGTMNLHESWNASATNLTSGTLNLGGTFTQANLGIFTRSGGGTAGTVNVFGTMNGGLALSNTTGSWYLTGGTLSSGTLSVTAGSAARLRPDGSGANAFTNVTINSGLDLESIYSGRVIISGATLNQTLKLGDTAGTLFSALIVAGSAPLQGTGTIVFGGHSSNFVGCRSNGEITTIGSGITLRGNRGEIGYFTCTLVNQGSIVADTAGGPLNIHFGSGSIASTGTLVVSGGTVNLYESWNTSATTLASGTLNLGGTFTQAKLGTFTRSAGGTAGTVNVFGTLNGGLALSDTTGSWYLTGGALSGGTLSVAAGSAARFRPDGSGANAFTNVTINSGLDLESIYSGRVVISGATLNQTLKLGDTAGSLFSALIVAGSAPLQGTGTIIYGAHGSNYVGCRSNGETTTIGSGITIRGTRGEIGYFTCTLVNQGSIVAETSGGAFNVHFGAGGGVSTGTLAATGGTLNLYESWNASATTLTSGALNLGGTFTPANLGTFTRGGLGTAGTVSVLGTLTGGLTLTNGWGDWYLSGGTLSGGVLDVAPGSNAKLIAVDSTNNRVNNVTINAGLDLESVNLARLSFANGSTLNQTVRLGNAAGTTYGRFSVAGNGTLAGTGTVILGGSPYNYLGCETNFSSTTIGPGITIRGKSGGVGTGLCSLTNQGAIIAETSGGAIFADFGSGGANSLGSVTVSGGTLYLDSAWDSANTTLTSGTLNLRGTFSQANLGNFSRAGGGTAGAVNLIGTMTGGLLLNDTFGSWYLAGGSLTDGILDVASGSNAKLIVVDNTNNRVTNIAIHGGLDMETSNLATLVFNSSTLHQTLKLGSTTGSTNARLWVANSGTLAGTGTIVLGGSVYNYLGCQFNFNTITIGAGITVRGKSGDIGGGLCAMTNQGTIASDGGGTVFVANAANFAAGTLTGGTWKASGSSTLRIEGANITTNAASITLDGATARISRDSAGTNALIGLSTIVPAGNFALRGGANWNTSGPLTNQGGLKIGPSSTLAINGAFTQGSSGTLAIDIGGIPASGLFGQMLVSGAAALGGTFDVGLVNGFGPQSAQTYTPITFAAKSGAFAAIQVPQLGGVPLLGVNVGTTHITIATLANSPDLSPSSVVIPSNANLGDVVQVVFTIQNLSSTSTPNQWTDSIYLSSDGLLGPDDVLLGEVARTTAVPGNASYTAALTAPIPVLNLASYRVIVVADSRLEVPDLARANNTLASQGTMSLSIDSHPLVLGQRVVGAIESRFSVDQWTFTGIQNQQVRFDWLSSAPNAAKFALRGPNGFVAFSDLTADSPLVTLPASGTYTLDVRSANGDATGGYAFQIDETSQTLLTLGTTYHGSFPGSGSARLFRLDLTDSAPILIHFDGVNSSDQIEVFAKSGSAPNRQTFDVRNLSTGADHTLAVPLGVPGPLFILVFAANVSAPSGFGLLVEQTSLTLSSVSPASMSPGPSSAITLRGLGLRPGTTVQLIPASGGVAINSEFVSVDSTSQITAYFNLSSASPGTYHVRATLPGGMNQTLNSAFEVTQGTYELRTRLILPSVLGRHGVATIYVEYANLGTATMPAPILVLESADPDNSDRPLLTLESDRVTEGFWTSALPDGFANSAQIFADGNSPGVLQPGESRRVPVYYAGLQQPWNFSDTQVEFNINVHEAGDPRLIDWPAISAELRPSHIQPDAWSAIAANLQAQIGPTWGDYVRVLSKDAVYLGRLGQRVSDVGELFGFELIQASGVDVVGALAEPTDVSLPTPGIPLSFGRSFASTIASRYEVGPFGHGWSTPWQRYLERTTDGTLILHSSSDALRRFQPDIRRIGAYFAAEGDNGTMRQVAGGAWELTEADGGMSRYYTDGRFDRQRDKNGNTILAGYIGNRLTTLSHSSGAWLTIAYNAAGRIISITDSMGRVADFGYDATNAHLTSVTSPAGTTTYTYATGQGAAQEHALTSIDDPSGVTQFFEYDSRGRLAASYIEANVGRTTYAYGSAGDVTVTDAAGVFEKSYFGVNGLLARSENASGYYVVSQFDGSSQATGELDALGRTTSLGLTSSGAVQATTDALNHTAVFDLSGPFDQYTSLTDARGNVTRYTYDAAGNRTSTLYADATSDQSTYDAQGLLDVVTNRRGQTVDRTVNSAGQVTREVLSDSSVIDYTYDSLGRLATATDAQGTTTLTYDAGDRLTRVEYPNGRWLEYAYDAAGRRIRMADQSGFATQYIYDSAGRLQFLRNAIGALVAQYDYDIANRLSSELKGNGTRTEYGYDVAGRILSIIHRAPGGLVSARLDYTYDSAGRVATMTTLDGTWNYVYDLTDQLVRAQFVSMNAAIANQDLNYEYDPLGNRVRTVINGAATSYSANSINAYTQVGTTTFTYDADGNLTMETGAAGTRRYFYDVLNRLNRVESPQGVWEYQYDALGNRIAVVANGQRTEFLVDPTGLGNVTAEYTGAGALTAHYATGFGLASRVDATGTAAYYNYDALGSSVQLTAANGTVQNAYAYMPFGEILGSQGTAPNPFTFVGAEGVMNDGNGLYFMRARFYQPDLGRFLNQDPIRLDSGDYNFQRYVGNNPVNQVDPSGLVDRGDESPIQACLKHGGIYDIQRGCVTPAPRCEVKKDGQFYSYCGPPRCYITADPMKGTSIGPCKPPSPPKPPPKPPKPPLPPACIGQFCFSGPPGGPGTAGSIDPNEKFGAAGFGPQAFVNGDAVIPYSVHFENLGPGSIPAPTHPATAPAQRVEVTDQLSDHLDWTTFEFTEIGFGDTVIPVTGSSTYQFLSIPVTDQAHAFNVEIELTFDSQTGKVRVVFQALDPQSFLPPDILSGILPPEDGTGRGKGYFNYRVRPVAGLPTGTEIRNIALIKFDANAVIATNQIDPQDAAAGTDPNREALNTIDNDAPTSHVNPLPATLDSADVPVSWSGNDGPGAGVASYDVYVSDNGGPFTRWLTDSPATSATYTGINGHSYRFYSVATDHVGLTEADAGLPDATVTIQAVVNQVLLTAGVVRIGGTPGNDTILVTPNGANLQVTLNGVVRSNTIPLASITQVRIFGHEANDTITATKLGIPLYVEGSIGTDQLIVNGLTAANVFTLTSSALTANGISYLINGLDGLTINGQAQADTFAVQSSPAFPVTIKGNGGSDTLRGPDSTSAWLISGSNAGTLNGSIGFSTVENLTGGSAADTFTVLSGKRVSGKVDGGGGADALNLSAYTTVVTVNLQMKTATGTGGFDNIESWVGGQRIDKFTAANQANLWLVNGTNSGAVGGVSFAGFETLTGGTQTDTFQIQAGAVVADKIDGGTGADLLDYTVYGMPATMNLQNASANGIGGFVGIEGLVGVDSTRLISKSSANVWNLTGLNQGTVGAFAFTGVGNLTGGSSADTFSFGNGARVTGQLDGAGGVDILKYTLYTTPIIVDFGALTATGAGSILNIDKVIGGSGVDTLVGFGLANTWSITSSNAGKLNAVDFSALENLTGGPLADAFVLSNGKGVTGQILGGAGRNTLDYSAYTTAVTVDLAAGTATNIALGIGGIRDVISGSGADTLRGDGFDNFMNGGSGNDTLAGQGGDDIVQGAAGNDTFTGGTGRDLLFSGIGLDTIDGGDGEDILVNGTTNFDTNRAALDAALAFWRRLDLDYTARVSLLRSGIAGVPRFISTSISNDTSADRLTGGLDRDWFFASLAGNATDLITDLGGDELTN